MGNEKSSGSLEDRVESLEKRLEDVEKHIERIEKLAKLNSNKRKKKKPSKSSNSSGDEKNPTDHKYLKKTIDDVKRRYKKEHRI